MFFKQNESVFYGTVFTCLQLNNTWNKKNLGCDCLPFNKEWLRQCRGCRAPPTKFTGSTVNYHQSFLGLIVPPKKTLENIRPQLTWNAMPVQLGPANSYQAKHEVFMHFSGKYTCWGDRCTAHEPTTQRFPHELQKHAGRDGEVERCQTRDSVPTRNIYIYFFQFSWRGKPSRAYKT